MLESKEIGLEFEKSDFERFLCIGIILLVFKIAGNNPEEKDLLNKNASWSDMSLFANFKILEFAFLKGLETVTLLSVITVGIVWVELFKDISFYSFLFLMYVLDL